MSALTFIILSLEGAVLSFNVAAVSALVPSIARDFGVSEFIVGRIIWVYMLPYGVTALLYGPLVRRFDAKKVELLCILLFSLANLLAALSGSVGALFWARFFMGVFGASVIPLGIILIGRNFSQGARGKHIGIFFAATFVASLAGLFLSGIIHWRFIFLIPALAGLFLCIPMMLFLPRFATDAQALTFNYGASLKDKRVRYLFTYILIISLLYHGVQQWLGVYFSSRYHFNQLVISGLITLTSLSGIFGEVIGGHCADAWGRMRTINAGIALMVISALVLFFQSSVLALGVIMVVWGLGWTFNHAGLSTLLTDLPKEFLNEAASLNSSVRFVSGGVGVALGGLVMQKSFSLGFGIFGVCLVGVLLLTRKLIIR